MFMKSDVKHNYFQTNPRCENDQKRYVIFFDDILGSSIYERISLILKKYVEKMLFLIFFLLANRMTALFC